MTSNKIVSVKKYSTEQECLKAYLRSNNEEKIEFLREDGKTPATNPGDMLFMAYGEMSYYEICNGSPDNVIGEFSASELYDMYPDFL